MSLQACSRRRPCYWWRAGRTSLAGLLLLPLMLARPSRAEPSDYLINVKDTENSDLPNSSVTAIAQTPDGYLWVGTFNGLARYDGLRFVTFDPLNTPALGHARIQDLFLDCQGTLWINTYRGGLTSYRDGVFRREWGGRGSFDTRTTLAVSGTNEVVFVTQSGEVLRRRPAPGELKGDWTLLAPTGRRLTFQCADREGTLWFLTRDGRIVRLIGEEFRDLAPAAWPPGNRAFTLAKDRAGSVWAGTDQGTGYWNGTRFETTTPTNGEPSIEASYLLPVRDGGLWVLSGGRLRKQVGRRWVAEATDWKGQLGSASGKRMGMHEDRDGGVWFNHYGNGLFHITPAGRFRRLTTEDGLPGDRVWVWFQGREGDVWVGLDRGGLAHLRDRRFRVLSPPEGQPVRAVLSVCEDAAGAVWFGTSGSGLRRWTDNQVEAFPVGGDSSANFVFSVFAQAGQGLWLSASAGEELFESRDGRLQRAPWEAHGVKAILADRTGRVWAGTKAGLNWWTTTARRSFGAADGMSESAVRALAEARDGRIWCGADDGTLYRCAPTGFEAFRPKDGLAGQPIWSLRADDDGTIWAGTFRAGLLRFKDGVFARLTSEHGLPSDVISQILDDGRGHLWLGTHRGICRVARTALNACLDGKAQQLDCVTYGRQDGLPSLECSGGYQPACWRGRDGRLWFSTGKGLVSVKPEDLKANPVPPPVVIEELRVDGEPVPLQADASAKDTRTDSVVIPPGRKQFEFRFTALSLIVPDNIRFRYRLKGLETEWVEAGTRRTANYANLPARDYQFQVLACNNDGIWNQEGSTLAFIVVPHFYQTWWFLTLTGAVVVAGVALGVRGITTRKYRRALARLRQQNAIERDRARIANDIHDDLGAGLTQITLLSELARRDPPEQAGVHLDRICESARKMTRAMDEIVWAVDPQHDTLSGLMDYVSAYTEDFLHTAGLPCRMDLPAELPPLRIEAELRYNLFLALKEALNNIVKHARATEVRLRLRLHDRGITLEVEDNGKGLSEAGASGDGTRLSSGHGLPNLEKRLAAVGGRFSVQSAPGQGTRVEITIPAAAAASPVLAMGQASPNELS